MDHGRLAFFLRHYCRRLLLLLAVVSTLVMMVISYNSWRHLTVVSTLLSDDTFLPHRQSSDRHQLQSAQTERDVTQTERGVTQTERDVTQTERDVTQRQGATHDSLTHAGHTVYLTHTRSGPKDLTSLTGDRDASGVRTVKKERPKPRTTREWMSVAAASVQCSFVPPLDKFAQDSYFHPSTTLRHADTPGILLSPPSACSQESQDPVLLVLVLSGYRHDDIEERQAVRDTYGSVSRGGRWPGKPVPMAVRLLFLMGRPPSEASLRHLQAESGEFGDVLVGDFVDSYENLTLKVLFGLRLAVALCPQADFILKADDDTFVNLPLLTTFLLERGEENSAYGYVYFTSRVVRQGRWAVSREAYPLDNYPPYLSGTAYVLSRDAAQHIVQAAQRVPFIPIEDAYITGVLAVVAGVRRMSTKGFTHFAEARGDLCQFVLDLRLVSNKMAAMDKHSLWNMLRIDDRRLCDAQNHIPRT